MAKKIKQEFLKMLNTSPLLVSVLAGVFLGLVIVYGYKIGYDMGQARY